MGDSITSAAVATSQKRPHSTASTNSSQIQSFASETQELSGEQTQKKVAVETIKSTTNVDASTQTNQLFATEMPISYEEGGKTDEDEEEEGVVDDEEDDSHIPDPAAILAGLVGTDLPAPTGAAKTPSNWLRAPSGPRSTRIGGEYQADV